MQQAVEFFKVNTDPDGFQQLWVDATWDPLPEQEPGAAWRPSRFRFDGSPIGEAWIVPEVYVRNPRMPRPDFYAFEHKAAFALSGRAREALRFILPRAGELLPVLYRAEELMVLNILACEDVLDPGLTEWWVDPDDEDGGPDAEGHRGYRDVDAPRFRLDRLPISTLFTVPETAGVDLYCYHVDDGDSYDFKQAVDDEGLVGLTFEHLYTDWVAR